MKTERKIRSLIVGKESGLSEGTQVELLNWEQIFNVETHRGLFTLFNTLDDALKDKLDVVGPSADEKNDAMFLNRYCKPVFDNAGIAAVVFERRARGWRDVRLAKLAEAGSVDSFFFRTAARRRCCRKA